MHSIRGLTFLLVVVAGLVLLAFEPAQAGRRGAFAHHSQVRVWHGNRVGSWSHHGRWSNHGQGWKHGWNNGWNHGANPGWNGGWNSRWGWSRAQGYPHRWWSWNARKHSRFASRRHGRHAMHHWGRGSSSQWNGQQRRSGVWYASPGFGSAGSRSGPARQGEWHSVD